MPASSGSKQDSTETQQQQHMWQHSNGSRPAVGTWQVLANEVYIITVHWACLISSCLMYTCMPAQTVNLAEPVVAKFQQQLCLTWISRVWQLWALPDKHHRRSSGRVVHLHKHKQAKWQPIALEPLARPLRTLCVRLACIVEISTGRKLCSDKTQQVTY
jgi:hypothetical protein